LRVKVERVNVGATVTNASQKLVAGLRREDFELLDNGTPQPLTAFFSIDDPAQVVLMIECGPSVYFFRKDLVRAADKLLTRLAPSDRVAIVCYTRTPELRLDFTTDKDDARAALQQLNFVQGFADLNLSASLFTTLDSLKNLPGKKTIVLVTTGVDTSPPADEETARQKLNASDVRVIAVSTASQVLETPKKMKSTKQQKNSRSQVKQVLEEAGAELRQISELTGGRVYTPKSSDDFDKAYAKIAELVRHEYNLEFAPPAHDGAIHAIEVRVKGKAYRVDHRQAYLAPSPD